MKTSTFLYACFYNSEYLIETKIILQTISNEAINVLLIAIQTFYITIQTSDDRWNINE